MHSNKPPELARCTDHYLVRLPSNETKTLDHCVACEFDIDARPDEDVPGSELTQPEFTRRLEWETVCELIPLMQKYLNDQDFPTDLWVSHIRWDGTLPAGYTEQERFVLAVCYRFDNKQKALIQNGNAEDTIETLRKSGYDND